MTTIKDILADARRLAYGSMSEQINILSASVAAGATTLTVDLDTSGITPGMVLSSGLNTWYVRGTSAADKQIFVIPGYDNSPKVAAAAGDVIVIKPRVTDWYLFGLFNDEMRKLSSSTSGLYRIDSWTVASEATYQTYEVPLAAVGMVGLLRVRWRIPGTPDVWTAVPPFQYRWQSTDDVSRVQLLTHVPSGTEVEFTYRAPFAQATSLDDDPVADCGLSDSMLDIPPLGMAVTLLRTTDARRLQISSQGDARRADEVPASSNLSTAAAFERDYKGRVQDEYVRLIQRNSIFRGI